MSKITMIQYAELWAQMRALETKRLAQLVEMCRVELERRAIEKNHQKAVQP